MIYLASPYSDPDPAIREIRFKAVCMCAARLIYKDLHIFSPIAHSHVIAVAGGLPTYFAYWRAFDLAMLKISNHLWIYTYPGWKDSTGIADEMKFAKNLGLDPRFIGPTPDELLMLRHYLEKKRE